MALNGFIMLYKAKPLGSNNHTMASSKNHINASSKNFTRPAVKTTPGPSDPKWFPKMTKT